MSSPVLAVPCRRHRSKNRVVVNGAHCSECGWESPVFRHDDKFYGYPVSLSVECARASASVPHGEGEAGACTGQMLMEIATHEPTS